VLRLWGQALLTCVEYRVEDLHVAPAGVRVRLPRRQPWKARLLLALALDRTSDPDEIQCYFDTY